MFAMVVTMAVHHAAPQHVADFLRHMEKAVRATEGAPGLIDFTCWVEDDGTRLIGLARWESRDAFEAALPRIGSHAHERDPAWTTAEDELYVLSEAPAAD